MARSLKQVKFSNIERYVFVAVVTGFSSEIRSQAFTAVPIDGDTGVAGGCGDSEKEEAEEKLPQHMTTGRELTFRVTVLQGMGIAADYSDVFCQFKSVGRGQNRCVVSSCASVHGLHLSCVMLV